MNAELGLLESKLKIADARLSRLESWYEGVRGEDSQDDADTLAAIENTYGEIHELKELLKEWENENAK